MRWLRAARWRVVAVLAIAGVVFAGCGVPDSGAPVVDGTPVAVPEDEQGALKPAPPRPEDATSSQGVVQLYFHAASSEWERIPDQVRTFLTDRSRGTMQPWQRVQVVRVSEWGRPQVESSSLHRVRVRGTVIGELAPNGVVHPADHEFDHVFQLRYHKGRGTWLIDNPPPGYVLSVEAVEKRFDALPLYFVNRWQTASLIPDLRYMPKAVEWRKQRSQLVDWLLQGPSPGIASVATNGFPAGTKRSGNVVVENGDVVVNLSSEADVSDRKDLMLAQLVWTLRPRMSRGLRLLIDSRPVSDGGRTTHSRNAYARLNAAEALPDESVAYYVDPSGRVVPLSDDSNPPRVLAVSTDGDDYNTGVRHAAVSRTGDVAALVRWDAWELGVWVGRIRGGGGDGVLPPPAYQRVEGLPATEDIDCPVWVGSAAGGVLLVPAAGEVYEVRLRDLQARPLPIPDELGPIQALKVSADGYRVALVADDQVYVAALAPRNDGGLALRDARPVPASISDVVDVAWSRESFLVLASRSEGLWEVSVDGVQLVKLPTPGAPDHVAAYPAVDRRGRVLVEHAGRVYEIYSSNVGTPAGVTNYPAGRSPFFAG